jgi:hypothetical protein
VSISSADEGGVDPAGRYQMITCPGVLVRRCLLLLVALAVGGLALFTPMSSVGAAPENPNSVVTGDRCEFHTKGIFGPPPTSWISGSTKNETASPLGRISFEKNNLGEWNPMPVAPVDPHGKNEWCAESFAFIFGGTSVKLTYIVKSNGSPPFRPGILNGFDLVVFEANVTAFFGGGQSCHVFLASPDSTTGCTVNELGKRPLLGIDFAVFQRGR